MRSWKDRRGFLQLSGGLSGPDGMAVDEQGNLAVVHAGLRPQELVRAGIARSFQDLRLFTGMPVLENVLAGLPRQRRERLSTLFPRPLLVRREDARNARTARRAREAAVHLA